MRVITGEARGRKLQAPEGFDVRPTTDKVKESLFNIIQFELEDRTFLDLFAGSGQIGIEALSRGARSAVFVDSSKKSLDIVKKNCESTGFLAKSKFFPGDAFSFIVSTSEKFDIAFLDPPYECNMCVKAFDNLECVMKESGTVICETKADENLPHGFGRFVLQKEYKYSQIKLSLYRIPNGEED